LSREKKGRTKELKNNYQRKKGEGEMASAARKEIQSTNSQNPYRLQGDVAEEEKKLSVRKRGNHYCGRRGVQELSVPSKKIKGGMKKQKHPCGQQREKRGIF